MNNTRYFFLPWLRTGLSTLLDGQGQNVSGKHRASLPAVKLKINNHEITWAGSNQDNGGNHPNIELYGPGDAVGFDHRIIIRTDPKPNVGDFEYNYFPIIEFSEADFAWRMSPAIPEEDNRHLRPWICLIVLKAPDGEGAGQEAEYEAGDYDPDLPLPFIKVLSKKSSLPDLRHCWYWAHVHVTSGDTNLNDELQSILKNAPERAVCRLMCPRKLEPGTLYHAFVVPTFESGRRAGRGQQDFSDINLLDLAWKLDEGEDAPVELPYYYKWEFRTSKRGDFEYLVRLLQPRPLGKEVGTRPMDCSNPGYNLPGVEVANPPPDYPLPNILGLEGALKSTEAVSTPLPTEPNNAFQQQLTTLLNLPEDRLQNGADSTPLIGPPLYGKWHAAIKKLSQAAPAWIKTLNLDPRYRAAAGLGTKVVREQQEKLMAAAWQQVGPIEEANEELRLAQLGREVSGSLLENKLKRLPRDILIRMAAPVHPRLLIERETDEGAAENVTIKNLFDYSPVPPAVLDPAFRRVSRRRGFPRVRQQPSSDPNQSDVLERLNEEEIAAAGQAPNPDGTANVGDISEDMRPWWATGTLWEILKTLPLILLILAILLYALLWILNGLGTPVTPNHPLAIAAVFLLTVAAFIIQRLIVPGRAANAIVEENLTEEVVEEATPPDDFPAPEAFREFAVSAQSFLNYAPPQKTPSPKPLYLNTVHTVLVDTLKPEKTLLSRLKRRLRHPNLEERSDPLERIMDAPVFPQPMYEALRDISQDYLLPGVQNVPQNTIGLLEANQRFVEAYLVGLNHEMARELLWREYPTDQRGSYFRQFWDASDTLISQEEEGEPGNNIKPIHQWGNSDLGENRSHNGSNGEKLVLLVRGDLLKKYPNTVIYAVRGEWKESSTKEPPVPPGRGRAGGNKVRGEGKESSTKERVGKKRCPIFKQESDGETSDSPETIRFPIFRGTLPPDITFLGFNLDDREARGSPDENNNDPGWFFVFEERISEARFGLDTAVDEDQLPAPDSWNNLSWQHFEGELAPSNYIDGIEVPKPTNEEFAWDTHAGTRAAITFQKPVRIAIHADDMLPENDSNQS